MKVVEIDSIKKNKENPRTIRDDKFKKLVKSLNEFPEMMNIRPIVVNKSGVILGGNMRYEAAKAAGWKEIPVEVVELSPEKEREFIIKDNVSGGEWDFDALANGWDVDELTDWGVDIPDTFEVKQEVTEDEFDVNEDIETDIVLGDMFQIGEHRLLCGDSTDSDHVARLMGGELADMIFTDPPYELESSDIYSNIKIISKNTNVLIFASDKQIPYMFDSKIGEFKRIYTLDTGIASPTNNDVYVNHIALLRFKIGEAAKFNNIHNGGRSIVKMEYRKNLKDEKYHDHQKPLSTLALFMQYWSNKGNIVVDLFGGSGSTMAASEQLQRKCYMMEFEPKNCQIIINRMKKMYNLVETKLI